MATWKDGPRYAPLTRPYGFAEPAEAVSLDGEPGVIAKPVAPDSQPDSYQQDRPVVPLESIVPTAPDSRDPNQAFDVLAAALTSMGEAHTAREVATNGPRTPDQPFNIVTSTPSVSSSWAPPPAPQAAPVQPLRQVSLSDCLTAAYPPFLILLAVVGLVALTEPFFAVLALVAAPFVFVTRVRFRVKRLRQINLAVVGGLALIWFVDYLLGMSTANIQLMSNTWILLGCWGLAVADVVLQWVAMRHGERPD